MTEIITELTDICRRQADMIDRLYLELAKIGAAKDMGDGFAEEAAAIAKSLAKYEDRT